MKPLVQQIIIACLVTGVAFGLILNNPGAGISFGAALSAISVLLSVEAVNENDFL